MVEDGRTSGTVRMSRRRRSSNKIRSRSNKIHHNKINGIRSSFRISICHRRLLDLEDNTPSHRHKDSSNNSHHHKSNNNSKWRL